MTLDDEDEIARAISELSLENVPEATRAALVKLFPQISNELQLQLIEKNPELQKLALQAIDDTLTATLASNDPSTQQAFDALAEIRKVISGELSKDDISDERWRFLFEKLIENGQLAVDKDTENKQFLNQQATADRRAKAVVAAMPHIQSVFQIGMNILIISGRI